MTVENRLFNREAFLTVGPSLGGEGRKFTTKINFSIEKTSSSSANKGKISIYNVSQDSRTFIEQKDMSILLEAGYKDATEILFIGDIAKNGVLTKRSGGDLITSIEAGDGERTLASANINKSWISGVTNLQIIREAVASLGLDLSIGIQKGLETKVFKAGYIFSGMVKDLLDEQIGKLGLEWSIQNGTVQILPVDDNTGEEAVFLSPETGLIGWPSKTETGAKGISLLNPKILPGRLVVVQSKQFKDGDGFGVFRVDKVVHKGDSQDGQYFSSWEGSIPKGTQAA